jgi:hypothetical protein
MQTFPTKLSRLPVIILVLFLSIALPAIAQVNFGRISGVVTDSSGAVVPAVKIQVLNEGTGVERTAVSNESGNYIATNLPVGVYTVKLEATGFQTVTRTGLNLVADGPYRRFSLWPGAVQVLT